MNDFRPVCPFCTRELPENAERFFCDPCGDRLLATMSPERRLGFANLNPMTLSPTQEMSPDELKAFETTLNATRGFTQTLELLDPGDPTNENDRNSHMLSLALPPVPFTSAAEIGSIAAKTLGTVMETTLGSIEARAEVEWKRRSDAKTRAETEFNDLIELKNAGFGIDTSEALRLQRAMRLATENAAVSLSDIALSMRVSAWPYAAEHTIMRVRREMNQIGFNIAFKFPTSEWEFVKPRAMDEAKYEARRALIAESLSETKDLRKANVSLPPIALTPGAGAPAGSGITPA